jgi:acetyltransferase
MLEPTSIVLIGASADHRKIGGRPLTYLTRAGYAGKLLAVNPRYESIDGIPCFPSVDDLPAPTDLALIAVSGSNAVEAVAGCGKRGIPFAVVFASGFAESGAEGRALQRDLAAAAAEQGVRILGPNGLGFVSTASRVIGTFATSFERSDELQPGSVSFVTQSGALGAFVFTAVQQEQVGFRYWISTGNEADLRFADILGFLATDPGTSMIAGYLEGVPDGHRFDRALELANASGKAVCLLKVGKSEIGRDAVRSHTAALAGSDDVFQSVFDRRRVIRIGSPQELVDSIRVIGRPEPLPRRQDVVVLTISGGVGAWMSDAFAERGVAMPRLADDVGALLRQSLPHFARSENPVDFTGQILNQPDLLRRCITALLDQPDLGVLVVSLGLQHEGGAGLAEDIAAAAEFARDHRPEVRIVVAWMAGPAEAIDRVRSSGVPVFTDFGRCVDAVVNLLRAAQAPPPEIADTERRTAGGPIVPDADGRSLSEVESKKILAAWGIEVPEGEAVADETAAAAGAARLGYPVVLKGVAAGAEHKSDLGLVRVGLADEDGVRTAYRSVERALADHLGPDANHAVLVERMVPGGVEVIVGVTVDEAFGPVILLGSGGLLTELVADRSLAVAPVAPAVAGRMISSTRIGRLLEGYRGGARFDREALIDVICRLSDFALANVDTVTSVDVNPLIVLEEGSGAVAADALIVTRSPDEQSRSDTEGKPA